MKLTLDTWQRVQLLATVQGTPAKIGSVRAGLQLLDIIDFSDDEAKSIGLVTNASGRMTRKSGSSRCQMT
jgi:hypothetical protein